MASWILGRRPSLVLSFLIFNKSNIRGDGKTPNPRVVASKAILTKLHCFIRIMQAKRIPTSADLKWPTPHRKKLVKSTTFVSHVISGLWDKISREGLAFSWHDIGSALRARRISSTSFRNSVNLSNETYPGLTVIVDYTSFFAVPVLNLQGIIGGKERNKFPHHQSGISIWISNLFNILPAQDMVVVVILGALSLPNR